MIATHLRTLLVLWCAAWLPGCAPGTDGARQACASTYAGLSVAYRGTTAWYVGANEALRGQATVDNIDASTRTRVADRALMAWFTSSLSAAASALDGLCKIPDAIDAGLKRDVPSLIVDIAAIGAKIAEVVGKIPKGGN